MGAADVHSTTDLGLLYRSVHQYSQEAHLRHAMITVALSWGLIPLVGAIPFLAIAATLAPSPDISETLTRFQNPWNAIFEAFSGFTSTGLTMALNPRELPYSLQWWRSFRGFQQINPSYPMVKELTRLY